MERILENYLDDFAEKFNFKKEQPFKKFEHFVNYISVPQIEETKESIESVSVGDEGNPGIDGLAIIVNDRIVTTKEQVDYFITALNRLEVEFFFLQSKTSCSFSMEEISSFSQCIKDFFSSTPKFKFNDDTIRLHELKNYIYTHTLKMQENPKVSIIYATTGLWQNDENLKCMISSSKSDLEATGLFSAINFLPYDRERLKTMYREIRNSITRTISFDKHTILPKIQNVEEAFIGMISAKEFINLVSSKHGDMIRNIFYDNVRDFQGFNPVNQEIKSTLESQEDLDKFALLNNGVTIVAKSIKRTGVQFEIRDFQIVNGCQTSHVLFYNRKFINENIFIPIKLIVTQDYELMSKIIRANNRQTTVGNEAFEILSPFHKHLEEYYIANSKKLGIELYYERRSNQYEENKITRSSYVTLSNQVKSFIAMFLNEPTNAIQRYYGELIKLYKTKMFQEQHKGAPYFTSGLCLNRLEKLFSSFELNRKYRRFKYHILMMIKIRIIGNEKNYFNSNKIETLCDKINSVILDEPLFMKHILDITRRIDLALNEFPFFRNAHSSTAFKTSLIPSSSNALPMGHVSYYNQMRGFGYIDIKNPGYDVWFHISDYQLNNAGIPSVGEELSFDIVDNEKGHRAINITKIEFISHK